MSRVVPEFLNRKTNVGPEWLDTKSLERASREERQEDKEMLSKVSSQTETVILKYACPVCSEIYGAGDPLVTKQISLQKREGKIADQLVVICPSCASLQKTSQLVPSETAVKSADESDPRSGDLHMSEKKLGTGTYNTYVDRFMVGKAVNELAKFAKKNGMTLAQAHYLKSHHASQTGQEFPTLNDIECVLEWSYGRMQKARVAAMISIDTAGNYKFPKIFKDAQGKEYPFEKEVVKAFEHTLDAVPSERKMKKSDQLNFRKPDPSRFNVVSSLSDEEVIAQKLTEESGESKKKVVEADIESKAYQQQSAPTLPQMPQMQPAQPSGMTPGQSVVNPADNKTYTLKMQNPDGGVTITDPATNQDMIVQQDQVTGLRPVVKTTSLEKQMMDTFEQEIMRHLDSDIGGYEDTNEQHMDMIHQDIQEAIEEGDPRGEQREIDQHMEMIHHNLDEIGEDQELLRTTNLRKGNMTWHEIRKQLKEKEASNKPQKLTVSQRFSTLDHIGFKPEAGKGEIGFDPDKPEVNETGRDNVTGVPVGEEKSIDIGMTEFPKGQKRDTGEGYKIPFKEMDEKQVEEREHFTNEVKLPIDGMRRDELADYVKGKGPKNFGLNQEPLDKESEALASIIDYNPVKKKTLAQDEGEFSPEVQERPIKRKQLQRAPSSENYKEPETIPEASSKAKEGITKLHQTEQEIAALKEQMEEIMAPFREKLQGLTQEMEEASGEVKEKVTKEERLRQSYIEMVYGQLSAAEQNVVAYQDDRTIKADRMELFFDMNSDIPVLN